MKPPAPTLRKCLIRKDPDFHMSDVLSIFEFSGSESSKRIYLVGITPIVKEIFQHLGGIKRVSILLNQKYSKVKEWSSRKPISLFDLNNLLNNCDIVFRKKIQVRIEHSEIIIKCRYSSRKVRFPKIVSPDLAYIVGLILGDGSLAGDSLNQVGNWNISICFENHGHLKLYNALIKQIFGFGPNVYLDRGCEVSSFSSRVLHWFFKKYFEFFNGYKCNKIFVPSRILNGSNQKVVASFLQGLFDSDGTFTNNRVKYSTTSKIMAFQVQKLLARFSISSSISKWTKGEYKPLYTVAVSAYNSVQLFSEKVGFRHPNKRILLENFINSPVV
jgi:hypothetical protein